VRLKEASPMSLKLEKAVPEETSPDADQGHKWGELSFKALAPEPERTALGEGVDGLTLKRQLTSYGALCSSMQPSPLDKARIESYL
jgi:hypothetical protein